MKLLLIFLNTFTIVLITTAHTESTTDTDDDSSSSSDSTESYEFSTVPNLISTGPEKSTFCTKTVLVVTNVTEFDYRWSFSGVVDHFSNMDPNEFVQSTFGVNNTDLKFNEEELPGNWSLFVKKSGNEASFSLEMVFKSRKPTCHLKLSPELQVSHPLFQLYDPKPSVRRQMLPPMPMDMHNNNYNYNLMASTTPSYINPNVYSNFSGQQHIHGHFNHNNNMHPHMLFTTTFEWRFQLAPSNATFQDDSDADYETDEDLDLDFHVSASQDRIETQQLSGKACNKRNKKYKNKDGRMKNGMQKNNRMA